MGLRVSGWVLATSFAAACAPVRPLGEVPIVGGTDAQQETVREALDEFDRATGPGRVELREVRIRDLDDIGGRYLGGSRRVELNEDVEGWILAMIVRHEVCHALDFTEDLVEHDPELYDALAEGRFDDPESAELYPTNDDRRGEMFAKLCALGSVGLRTLTTTCRIEDPFVAEAAAVVLDAAYTEPRPDPIPVLGGIQASWAMKYVIQEPVYSGAAVPGALNVRAFDPDDDVEVSLTLDLLTGAELPGAEDVAPPEGPPPPPGFYGTVAGWPDGPAVMVGSALSEFTFWPRTIVWDAESGLWTPATEPCGGGQPFVVGDEIWLGNQDFSWGPTGLVR